MNDLRTAYLFWLGCFVGLAGLHRLYNKRRVSGLIWLCTWGLLGVGQLLDLFLIPRMVHAHNLKIRRKLGLVARSISRSTVVQEHFSESKRRTKPSFIVNNSISEERLMVVLAQLARDKGGKVSVTQAVVDTGVSFNKITKTLEMMVRAGYVSVDNDPETGIVVYEFLELWG